MKKILLTMGLLTMGLSPIAHADDLWSVYQQALNSDPTFQIAIANEREAMEAVPQSIAQLLPQIMLGAGAGLSKQQINTNGTSAAYIYGAISATQRSRSVGYQLSLQQSIWNFSYWMQLKSAKNSVKAATATFNSAGQDLMMRAAKTYFAILEAQEILRYTKVAKDAIYQEFLRAKQSFLVGLATITDVYNAKAAYDLSISEYVTQKNEVENKKEDLRAITGKPYRPIKSLKENIPLVSPNPINPETWVETAVNQNWDLVAAKYNTLTARANIKAAQTQHLPTVNLSTDYSSNYVRTFGEGRSRVKGPSAALDVSVPLFEGGAITSQTRQAIAKYEATSSEQEKAYRGVVNDTRKSYLAVLSAISKVKADNQAVISNTSSLRSMQIGYEVGTRTIVDVLNAQKALYTAQRNYATDRYSYIINGLTLKKDAGILSEEDLKDVNAWLIKKVPVATKPKAKPAKKPAAKKPITEKRVHIPEQLIIHKPTKKAAPKPTAKPKPISKQVIIHKPEQIIIHAPVQVIIHATEKTMLPTLEHKLIHMPEELLVKKPIEKAPTIQKPEAKEIIVHKPKPKAAPKPIEKALPIVEEKIIPAPKEVIAPEAEKVRAPVARLTTLQRFQEKFKHHRPKTILQLPDVTETPTIQKPSEEIMPPVKETMPQKLIKKNTIQKLKPRLKRSPSEIILQKHIAKTAPTPKEIMADETKQPAKSIAAPKLTTTATVPKSELTSLYESTYLQIGSYSKRINAIKVKSRLEKITKLPIEVLETHVNGQLLYRVQVGPIDTDEQTKTLTKTLKSAGF